MKTKANASRARRNLMRGVVLTVAMLAAPSLHAEDAAKEVTRVDLLRKQMLDEQLQMQIELRELKRTLARERTADAEQRRALARTLETQAAEAEGLRAELAAQRTNNLIVYAIGGIALLLLGGFAAIATARRGRTQALALRDQLDAIERRHREELRELRTALQHDLERVAARRDGAGAAPASHPAPVAGTATARVPGDGKAAPTVGEAVRAFAAATSDREPTRRAPLPSSQRTANWQASPTVETQSSPERMANERIVMTSPLAGVRRATDDAVPAARPEAAAGQAAAPERTREDALESTLELAAADATVTAAPDATEASMPAAATPDASAGETSASAGARGGDEGAGGEIELVYDPTSIVIEEEEATSPADADARWQALTGAPLTQLETLPAAAPVARSELRGNLTMENHSGTFAASHTNLANARRTSGTAAAAGNVDAPFADEPRAGAAEPGDSGAPGTPALGTPQMDTLDPAKVSVASVWPGPSEHTELRARLAALELHDDLRRHLNGRPDLLRGLVEEALGVVLKPTHTRSIEDWRLLVLDAWRRDNMQEALARTDSMILAATTDSDRTRAHMHRALVLDRIARLGGDAAAAAATQAPLLDDPEAAAAAAAALEGVGAATGPAAGAAAGATGARAEQPGMPEPTPAAMLREAVRLRREQRDMDAARRCLDALIGRLDPRADALQARLWIRALINLALVEAAPGGDASRAIALYDRVEHALQGIPPSALSSAQATSAAQALFNRAVLRYERRNDVAGALEDYRRVVAQFGGRPDLDVVLTVAHALSNQAWLLAYVHKDAFAAAALYQDLDRRFGEHRHRDIAFLVASGLFSAAVLSARELRAPSAALDLYRKLVNRHELTADPAFVNLVAKSLFNIGALLGAQPNGVEHAIEAYSSLIDRCADNDDPALAEWVAGAMVNKAALLLRQGDIAAARASYMRTVQAFADSLSVGAAEQVSRALFNLAGVASQQGDVDGAVQAYNDLLKRQQPVETLRHEHIVARAFANLAYLHANPRKDTEQALAAFASLLTRFKAREELELAEQCARALLGTGVLLATRCQDYPAAAAAYEELAARYGTYQEPGIAVAVAKALFNLASLQARQLNDLRATLATLTRLVERYTGHREPEVEVRVISGLLTRARVQERLGDRNAARESYQQLLTRHAGHDDPRVHKYVDAAQRALGIAPSPRDQQARAQPPRGQQPGGQPPRDTGTGAGAATAASLAATQTSKTSELHDDFLS